MSATQLKGKTALITGATKGIGLAIARALATEDVQLGLLARSAKLLDQVAGELSERVSVLPLECDVANEAQVADAVASAARRFGAIDILVNNAGTYVDGPLEDSSIDDYERTFDVNVRGLILTTRYALPYLKARNGNVINMASTSGLIGKTNQTLYCASKFAVVGFSEALQQEVASSGVSVSYLCPGPVNTWGAEESEGLLTPESIADIVLFVLKASSDAAVRKITVYPR